VEAALRDTQRAANESINSAVHSVESGVPADGVVEAFVARGTAREDSDVDVMYELHPGKTISLFRLVDLADALSPLFEDRRVDLCRETQLNPIYLSEVRREARVVHAE
ncbi:MAG TPA: hypothetical protein PKB10_10850, partial [Tepidisphaeraceae bacterium]|nr:hypothetical protein [Tepidisphaeraceae bacterium]